MIAYSAHQYQYMVFLHVTVEAFFFRLFSSLKAASKAVCSVKLSTYKDLEALSKDILSPQASKLTGTSKTVAKFDRNLR